MYLHMCLCVCVRGGGGRPKNLGVPKESSGRPITQVAWTSQMSQIVMASGEAWRVSAMFGSQAKSVQQQERWIPNQTVKSTNEAHSLTTRLPATIKWGKFHSTECWRSLKPPYTSPGHTVPRGDVTSKACGTVATGCRDRACHGILCDGGRTAAHSQKKLGQTVDSPGTLMV